MKPPDFFLISATETVALEKLESEASVGPWIHSKVRKCIDTAQPHPEGGVCDFYPIIAGDEDANEAFKLDAALIATVRNLLPRLLQERKALMEALVKFNPFEFDDECPGCGLKGTDHCKLGGVKHAPDCIWVACKEAVRK